MSIWYLKPRSEVPVLRIGMIGERQSEKRDPRTRPLEVQYLWSEKEEKMKKRQKQRLGR